MIAIVSGLALMDSNNNINVPKFFFSTTDVKANFNAPIGKISFFKYLALKSIEFLELGAGSALPR